MDLLYRLKGFCLQNYLLWWVSLLRHQAHPLYFYPWKYSIAPSFQLLEPNLLCLLNQGRWCDFDFCTQGNPIFITPITVDITRFSGILWLYFFFCKKNYNYKQSLLIWLDFAKFSLLLLLQTVSVLYGSTMCDKRALLIVEWVNNLTWPVKPKCKKEC